MSAVLEQLNLEVGDVVDRVRQGLVQVHNGRRGAGSGTIWHGEGLIVTNAHVVSGHTPGNERRRGPSRELRVTLPNGTNLPARLLARDEGRDVAALLVEAKELTPIELGTSRDLQPGQWVLAMGYPWGVAGVATAGIVIGTGEDLPGTPSPAREWIAVSLELRPGHSGGPLVDVHGRLVGVNTMMSGPQVGMAVPVHEVKEFLRRELGSATSVRVPIYSGLDCSVAH